eukprot:SAG11_NODE_36674_length_260_cov_0.968944_1_plen_86_part_11
MHAAPSTSRDTRGACSDDEARAASLHGEEDEALFVGSANQAAGAAPVSAADQLWRDAQRERQARAQNHAMAAVERRVSAEASARRE